jgi:hypothetical protein
MLEEGKDEGEGDKVEEDPYTRWRMRSSKSLSEQFESLVRELRLDKGGRRRNTFAESRCCSDSCCEKTEGENIGRVFIFTGKLNRKLNRELNDR